MRAVTQLLEVAMLAPVVGAAFPELAPAQALDTAAWWVRSERARAAALRWVPTRVVPRGCEAANAAVVVMLRRLGDE